MITVSPWRVAFSVNTTEPSAAGTSLIAVAPSLRLNSWKGPSFHA
jgi:hypothetical protein